MAFKLSQNAKGISSIIGSCFFYLVLGSTYVWGNINLYVTSYYKSLSSDQTSMVFPISSFIGNFGIIFSFPLVNFIGFRKTVYLSVVLIFGCYISSAFCPDFWSFFMLFGIANGIFIGFLYLTLMYNNYKYFPSKRGLISGIGMGVYGVAALISNYILLFMINPDNVKAIKNPRTGDYEFPDEIANRLPSALRNISFYFLGVMILGTLLVFEFKDPLEEKEDNVLMNMDIKEDSIIEQHPEEIRRDLLPQNLKNEDDIFKGEKLNNDIENIKTVEPNAKIDDNVTIDEDPALKTKKKSKNGWSLSSFDSHDERRCFSVTDAFKTKTVYLMIVMIFMSVSNGYFIANNFKNYGITKISDDQFLTLVGSLGSVFNGGGRFFWGFLYDIFDFKKLYLLILVIQMVNIATIRFISCYEAPYLIWVCVALLCEGGNFVLFPPLCLKVFGPNVGSKLYSLLLLFCGISNLAQFGVNTVFKPMMGYDNEFYIFLGMTLVSFLICIFTELKYRKKN